MAGIIKRKKKDKDFVILDKTCLLDKNLSFKAKGLHSYLMQLPDDWNINIADLTNRSKDGRDSVASAINELIKAGYVSREVCQNNKGLLAGYDYTMYEHPRTVNGLSVNGLSVTNKDYCNEVLLDEVLLKSNENLKNDFQNPSKPSSTFKEEKEKKGTPGPCATFAKLPAVRTGQRKTLKNSVVNCLILTRPNTNG